MSASSNPLQLDPVVKSHLRSAATTATARSRSRRPRSCCCRYNIIYKNALYLWVPSVIPAVHAVAAADGRSARGWNEPAGQRRHGELNPPPPPLLPSPSLPPSQLFTLQHLLSVR